ncbi:unnamed protein product [Penicillium pancosmium]
MADSLSIAKGRFSNWYTASESSLLKPAAVAFTEARDVFEKKGTTNSKKKLRLDDLGATSLEDILVVVESARLHYDKDQSGSKLRRYMEQISERIHYYGNIMDVLVQHHPEYVSLAWGIMKLLFGAIIEHKKIGSIIANGVLDIADALPRAKLASTLYPTDTVRTLVATLYAHIIRFLLRALEWYEEGSLKRAYHSVMKPAPLRYNDILDDIHRMNTQIAAHATAGSQAEQRDMYQELVAMKGIVKSGNEANTREQKALQQKLQVVANLVSKLKIDIHSDQALAKFERGQIHKTLTSVHSTQLLQVISNQCIIDHKASLEMARNLRNRRRFSKVKLSPFWNSTTMGNWNRSPSSLLIIVKVPFSDRKSAQDFCTNSIEQLLDSKIASFWVLKTQDDSHPIIPTLKSLINQAATFISQTPVGSDLAQGLDGFHHAQLEEHYIHLLADILNRLKIVYIIVQLEAIEAIYSSQFTLCLQQLIDRLASLGAPTVVRILVLSWKPGLDSEARNAIPHSQLRARKSSRRKAARLPNRPLLSHQPELLE